MRVIDKVIRGDQIRRTRFHTEEGLVCELNGLPEIIPSLFSWACARCIGRRLERPWWVWRAIRFVEPRLLPSDQVLEVGSGASTVWLARRCRHVRSIEESPEWTARVMNEARTSGLTNVEILSGDSRVLGKREIEDRRWDVIIIDCPGDRLEIFEHLFRSAARPRMVVYDDTDRAQDRRAKTGCADDYELLTFVGFKPQTLHVCETSIFMRRERERDP